MKNILETAGKSLSGLLNGWISRRPAMRRIQRGATSVDPLEQRCLLTLGDVLQTYTIHSALPSSTNAQVHSDVDLKGNLALVGEWYSDFSSNTHFRDAKLFNANTGSTLASFFDPQPLLNGIFASNVALTDSYALFAKSRESGSAPQLESLFVFDLQGNHLRTLLSPNANSQHGDGFASVLATTGNLVLIGAPQEQVAAGATWCGLPVRCFDRAVTSSIP